MIVQALCLSHSKECSITVLINLALQIFLNGNNNGNYDDVNVL